LLPVLLLPQAPSNAESTNTVKNPRS